MALQLDFSSKFTVVFIVCLPVALFTISYLNDGASHCLSFTELIIYIWQLLCHEGMKFKIRTQWFFFASTLFIQLYARVGNLAFYSHMKSLVHDRIVSLIGEFVEVPVPSQHIGKLCINFASVSVIFSMRFLNYSDSMVFYVFHFKLNLISMFMLNVNIFN